MRVCLIGVGNIGSFIARTIVNNKHIDIICIVDVNVECATALVNDIKTDTIICKDIDFVLTNLADSFQSVIIATPSDTHYEMITKCLYAGKHILCESPLEDISHIQQCFDLANNMNLTLSIGFQKRFDKHYMEFMNKIHQSGQLKNINFTTRYNSLLSPIDNIIEDQLSHDIDITNLIMKNEKPYKIIAFSNITHNESTDDNIEDINVMMLYHSSTTVTLSGSKTSKYTYDQRAEAYTNETLIQMNNQSTTVNIIDDKGINTNLINDNFQMRYKEAYENELELFRKIIEENIPSMFPTVNDLTLNMEICDAINISLLDQEVITLI